MERNKKKQLHNLRIIATNIFMGISVVAIAGILTMLAMGFRLSKEGNLEQSGLVQVKSNPSDATVEIDGKVDFYRTEMSKMLPEGEHSITVAKSGYDTWSTRTKLESGLLNRIDWVRLFPINRTIEDVKEYQKSENPSYNPLHTVSVSPDKYYIATVYGENSANGSNIELIDIHEDEIKSKLISTPFFPLVETLESESIKITTWSKNHNKFILWWGVGDTLSRPYLIDIENPENNIDLTTKFALNFSDIQFADASGTKLWALENGNLRLIQTEDSTLSDVLVPSVEHFSNQADRIGFIGQNEKSERIVGHYKAGDETITTIQKINPEKTSTRVIVGSNWISDWIAFALDNQLTIKTGDKFQIITEENLNFTPTTFSASPTNRFLIASSGNQVTTIDIELENRHDFEFPGERIHWLDNYLLWTDQDNQLSVVDFNGENRRNIAPVTSGYDLALTHNNHWLYFLTTTETSYTLQRERL